MWTQFFLENIHFALNLFAAFVMFAIMWLYFDAWIDRKSLKDALKIVGLFLLTISFLIHATYIESPLLSLSLLGGNINQFLVAATKIPGYLFLILGILIDPLQGRPEAKDTNIKTLRLALPIGSVSLELLPISYPILATVVAFLYLRRATIGMENHLKAVSLGFYILAIFELVSLTELFQKTVNVDLYKLVAPFNFFWFLQHAVLLFAVFILGRWVYYYLLKRLQSQLFMIFTALILVIFLLTTTSFTFLLLKNLQDETFNRLETDVKVLNFALESKKTESLSDAQILSNDVAVIASVDQKIKSTLIGIAENFLLTKGKNFVVIVSDTGQVLARGEDRERVGDSLSDDLLIKRSLLGESVTSVIAKDGVLGPEVSVRSASPIKKEGITIGSVMTGVTIDNAFVDGVKAATGLEAAIYGDNILSSSTILASDGKSRYIGIKEEGKTIKEKVLEKGESHTGSVNLLNTPYFAAYLPLKDIDNTPVGMLFVGKPQSGVLQAAGKSIELTFIVAAILLVLAIIPAYLVARSLSRQLR